MDDVIFYEDILICKSQGNEGDTDITESGPEAWAKNIVSVGGLYHYDDISDRSDHRWAGGASVGPAEDGRIKPDLVNFYDGIFTTSWVNNHCCSSACTALYCTPTFCAMPCDLPAYAGTQIFPSDANGQLFGGTSAATPITAGAFGLLFQMWHEEVFPGFGGGASVFADRPHFTTAKALMINTAYRYAWHPTAPEDPNPDLTRMRQGWGMANLHDSSGFGLYDLRNKMLIINETTDMTYTGQVVSYSVTSDGTEPLRITLVYPDPAGTTSSYKHRINDLSLKVVRGNTVWWGNYGLTASNWSASGGSEDHYNTVENVFIEDPDAGDYTVSVKLSELNEDGNPETEYTEDADYALVVSGITTTGSSRRADFDSNGDVDAADLMLFIDAFLGGTGDFDRDGRTSALDLFTFLNEFLSYKPPHRREVSNALHP
jgi:serine protease AprX